MHRARISFTRRAAAMGAVAALCAACVSPPRGATGVVDAGPQDGGIPYQPVSVSSAVAKVKDLLVGLPPTDAEVQAVSANQSALSGLVQQWMALPQYNAKMQTFFAVAFQQTQVAASDFAPQFNAHPPFARNAPQILENMQQSFARTVMELIAEGQPFTSVATTQRFMMTPALMAAYAVLDAVQIDDTGKATDLFQKNSPTALTLESSTMVPIEQAIDPTSASYMTFYDPTLATSYDPNCPIGTAAYPSPISTLSFTDFLYNRSPRYFLYDVPDGPANYQCQPPAVPQADAYFTDSDFTTWQMVNVRAPNPGEATTALYDLPAMRAGNDLVLNDPRVGYYTTPTFLAEWATNQSNLARVTLNQTMIVGLGEPIDMTNTTVPKSLAALDAVHATPGSTCYGCHQSLDPMRQFFRQAYSLSFSVQTDTAETSMPGQFAFHGVAATGTGIFDLGTLIAGHPMFAAAWVQKLCTYADSAPCDESDPEFMRLVSVFTSSNYSWNALVQALFSSPIVTYLQDTRTADVVGETFPIARQEHLCAMLSNRLAITDVCGLDANTVVPASLQPVQAIAATWPSDQYSRGNAAPVLANAPSLFMRAGMENLCVTLADYLIDNTKTGQYQSTNAPAALQSFVTNLMGLTSDRSAPVLAILQSHFSTAQQDGATASNALKSTFVLACLSPYVIGVGQ